MNQHYKLRLTRFLGAFWLLVFLATSAVARVSSTYSFTSSIKTYKPIVCGALLSTSTDEVVSYPLQNIGIPFVYNLQALTIFGVHSNGYVTLWALVTNTYPISLTSLPKTLRMYKLVSQLDIKILNRLNKM